MERRPRGEHRLLHAAGCCVAGVGGKSGRPRTAHLALRCKEHHAADCSGVRSGSWAARKYRAMLPGRTLAEEALRITWARMFSEDIRLQRAAGIRSSKHSGHL